MIYIRNKQFLWQKCFKRKVLWKPTRHLEVFFFFMICCCLGLGFCFFFFILVNVTKLESTVVLQPCCGLQGRLFEKRKPAKLSCNYMNKDQQTTVKVGWWIMCVGNKVKEFQGQQVRCLYIQYHSWIKGCLLTCLCNTNGSLFTKIWICLFITGSYYYNFMCVFKRAVACHSSLMLSLCHAAFCV